MPNESPPSFDGDIVFQKKASKEQAARDQTTKDQALALVGKIPEQRSSFSMDVTLIFMLLGRQATITLYRVILCESVGISTL